MIKKEYFEGLYKIEPVPVAMDFSEAALEQALIQLKFDLNENAEYILYLGRDNIRSILKLNNGYNTFNIKVEIQEDLTDGWYLVKNKSPVAVGIVYSPGV